MKTTNLETVEKLIELVRRHGIHQLSVEENGTKISVTASAPQGAAPSMFPGMMPQIPGAYAMPHMAAATHAPAPVSAEGAAPAAPAAKKVPAGKVVKSPFVGTFYRSSSPGSEPFAEIGKRVKKGDTLCIVEAMKLMNEIEAEFDGVIKEVLVDNEQPVEFDQPLFVME